MPDVLAAGIAGRYGLETTGHRSKTSGSSHLLTLTPMGFASGPTRTVGRGHRLQIASSRVRARSAAPGFDRYPCSRRSAVEHVTSPPASLPVTGRLRCPPFAGETFLRVCFVPVAGLVRCSTLRQLTSWLSRSSSSAVPQLRVRGGDFQDGDPRDAHRGPDGGEQRHHR